MADEIEYIAIKNWEKYQEDNKGKVRTISSPWIKDWTDKDSDYDYSRLTALQRYTLDVLRRYRGKTGHWAHNDPTYIARWAHILPRDSAHIAHAIRTLHTTGLISLVKSKDSKFSVSKSRVDKSREEKNRGCDNCSSTSEPLSEFTVAGSDEPRRYCQKCIEEAE